MDRRFPLGSAAFVALDVGENQVNVFANSTVDDPSFINQMWQQV
jgi:hypothetical protein